jgi:hypothetical protein
MSAVHVAKLDAVQQLADTGSQAASAGVHAMLQLTSSSSPYGSRLILSVRCCGCRCGNFLLLLHA